eukprot:10242598-Ditylum_brightwellii.AAC.1
MDQNLSFLSPSLLSGKEDDGIPNISDLKEKGRRNINDRCVLSSEKWISDNDTFEARHNIEKMAACDKPWEILEKEGEIDVKSKQDQNEEENDTWEISFSPQGQLVDKYLGSLFAVALVPVASATDVLCLLAPGPSTTLRGEHYI